MWILAGALSALSLPAWAAEVDKLLPENTEVVAVINLKQLIESPLVQKHALEHLRAGLKSNEEVSKILDSLGFDPFKDLTSITLGGAGIGLDMKGLIIAHGQFDAAKFEGKAEEVAKDKGDLLKVHKEGDRKLFEVKPPDQEKPLFVGIVDKTTIVAGPDKEGVLDAFDKAAGKKKGSVSKEIQGLIEKADGKQSLWFAMPGTALGKSDLTGDDKAKKIIEKIDSITGGVAVTKDVKFELAINTKSADDAKELAEELKQGLDQAKGFLAILAGQTKEIAPIVDFLGAMKVDTEASKITLKSEVSEELIEKGLKK
jgi:hypothetical protein